MKESILDWLSRFGYAGVALGVFAECAGVPIPGEAALFTAAIAAAHGALSLPLVIGTGALAALLGDNLGYLLGRWLGRSWLERHGRWLLITPRRLERVDQFYSKYGPWASVFARFLVGARLVAAWAAGIARMPWATFFCFNLLGAVTWALVIGLSGYGLGHGSKAVYRWLGPPGLIIALPILTLLLAAWLRTRLWRRWLAGKGNGNRRYLDE